MVKSYPQVNREQQETGKEEWHEKKHRKFYMLAIFALLVALIGYSIAQTAQDTADINNVFAIVVNNTDLYPDQRVQGVTYWANDSPIAVYVLFHAIDTATPQHFDSNFTINNSVVIDKDFNSAAGAGEHEHWSFYTIVPKGANYSITNSTNVYQIEWREYPILSGKNGTLSVNQTFVGSSYNATYDAYGSSKVNKSGDTMTGVLDINVTYGRTNTPKTIIRLGRNSTTANAFLTINDANDAFNFRVNMNEDEILTNSSETAFAIALRPQTDTWAILRKCPTGCTTQEELIGGTSNTSVEWKGNLTALDAGKGVIVKSPDGTKCGILTWSNADTLASTAITCP